MPMYELVRRILRGLFTMLITAGTVVVWTGLSSLLISKFLLLGALGLVLALMLLDPAGLRSSRRRGVGILLVQRMSFLFLSAAVVLSTGVSVWLAVTTVTLGALFLMAESVIFRLLKSPLVWSTNIPGAPEPLRETKAFHGLTSISMVAPVAALLPQPGYWLAAISMWGVLTATLTAVLVIRRAYSRRKETELCDAVRKFDPEMILFTSQVNNAVHQVAMWLPYLERTGKRLLIMPTTDAAGRALSNATEIPVAVRRTVGNFEKMAGPSLGAVFYVNANSANNLMVRYSEYMHVHLGHGDSDKPSSYNPTHGMYDRIFSAGQAAVDRYSSHGVDISPDKFRIVGRPQVEEISVADTSRQTATKTLFYAPTWRGHVEGTKFHSLLQGVEIIDEVLSRGLRVIFRPHPYSYEFEDDYAVIQKLHRKLQEDKELTGTSHIWGEEAEKLLSVTDCINQSDFMISDVSSVVSDFLYSAKPFTMMAISTTVDDFASQYPIARGAYVVGEALEELPSALDEMLGADSLREQRAEVRAYYLGAFAGENYAQQFVDEAAHAVTDGQAGRKNRRLQSAAKQDTASTGSSPTDPEAVTFLDSLRYKYRRLRAISGVKQLQNAHKYTIWALLAWGLTLAVSGSYSYLFAVVVFIGATAFYWSKVFADKRLIRNQVGYETLFTLLFVLIALTVSYEFSAWGYVIIAGAVALNYETRALQGQRGIFASKLPGLKVEMNQAPVLSAFAAVSTFLAVALVVVLPVFEFRQTWAALAIISAVLAGSLTVCGFIAAIWQANNSRKDVFIVKHLIEKYAPEFAIYMAAAPDANYQYEMWEPYFRQIDKRYIIISRNKDLARRIASATLAPVIYAPTIRSLDDVVPDSMTTVFYVNNGVKNTHMIERLQTTSVWLNHGDSEKPACYNPVHAIYDVIFAAGEAGIDRYARHGVEIPREKFMITGRPQVEQIARSDRAAQRDEKTVLYAPTWVGPYADSNVYSLPVAEELVAKLLARGVRVIFRAHPLNYKYRTARRYMNAVQALLQEDKSTSGRNHIWGEEAEKVLTVEECFNQSDAMISDISAMVSDYLQSEKPLAIMAMYSSSKDIEAEIPAAGGAYVISGSLDDVDAQLERLLTTDPLAEERKALRKYYLGDFDGSTYADAFLNTARSIIDGSVSEGTTEVSSV